MRLEDTVYAEFNSLRPVVETLRGKPVRFTGKELSGYIRASQESDRFRTSLEALEYAGIISVTGQGVITVARLYRPALRISRGRHSGISIAEERSLEKRVDLAMATWPQGGLPVELPDMSAQERKFIHDYVRTMYPDYSTAAFSGGKLPELKTLVIQKRTQNASRISPNTNITRKSPRGSNGKLQSYDPAHIELLLKLRNEAAGADGYFIGPALEGSLALTLVEIDRLLRKNKARRRVLGILADDLNVRDLENGEVQLILGSCNAWIIDTRRELKNPSEELLEGVTNMINGFCDIVTSARRPAVVTFSCLAVKSFVMSVADQYPTINFVDPNRVIMNSPLAVILQP